MARQCGTPGCPDVGERPLCRGGRLQLDVVAGCLRPLATISGTNLPDRQVGEQVGISF